MVNLIANSSAGLLLATAPETLARRGGGGGIVRAIYWVWRGIQTGSPIAIGIAGLTVAGVGFWIYSAVTDA